MLAGISVEYYTQLERGNVKGVSEDVLEAVTRASATRRHRTHPSVRPDPRRQTTPEPAAGNTRSGATGRATGPRHHHRRCAFIRNPRADFLTGNRLAYALYTDAFTSLDRPVSLPRFVFLDPRPASSTDDGKTSLQQPSAASAPKPPATLTTTTSPR